MKDLNIKLRLLMEKIKNLEEKEVEKDVKIKEMEITIRGNEEKLVKLEKILTEIAPKKISKDIGVICKECGESFPNKRDLTDHIKNIHPKEYRCKMCEKSFCESWSFELHSKSHEEGVPFCQTLGLVLRLRVEFVLPLSLEQEQEEKQEQPLTEINHEGVY